MSLLPSSVLVLERGWLSSNNILFFEGGHATLVDSGYLSHASQTLALVAHALQGRRLHRLINTHSHSDHIGGNAALRGAHDCSIAIPAGMADAVSAWDEEALLLSPAGQQASPFAHDALIHAGDELDMGGLVWRAMAAPGHDPHALMFYCAERRILISGDALWRNGFGVVFSELLGDPDGLASTRRTLESIGRLPLETVIPGHGPAFNEVDSALEIAFQRLAAFEANGERLARHALKALLGFALLDRREMARDALPDYLARTPIYPRIDAAYLGLGMESLAQMLVDELVRAGSLRLNHGRLIAP